MELNELTAAHAAGAGHAETGVNNAVCGKAARQYVLWRRVSTKQQGDSGLGLEAQTSIARYCMDADPVDVYTDVYTGTDLDGCVNLWAAVERCKQSGELLVIAKTDRFRNVKEALNVLDEVGDGNLNFCDLPTTDRMVLTIVFAVWEKQAMIGRFNTRVALAERKKEAAKNGHWISKAGNVCTHLGNSKGCDMEAAHAAAREAASERRREWRENSAAYKYARAKMMAGCAVDDICMDLSVLEDTNRGQYLTRTGKRVSVATLNVWKREIMPNLAD